MPPCPSRLRARPLPNGSAPSATRLPLSPQGSPKFVHGHTQEQAVLDTPGEVFALRKLLPATEEYDFNMVRDGGRQYPLRTEFVLAFVGRRRMPTSTQHGGAQLPL